MATWAPQRDDTLNALADEILHNYGRGRVAIAVDGWEGAGTAAFADLLAAAVRRTGHAVFRASIGDFRRRPAPQESGGTVSAEAFYQDTVDDALLRRVLIEPFRLGGSATFVTAGGDASRDLPPESSGTTGPADALLVVDGPFLNRPEIAGIWNYSIWLDVPAAVSERRVADETGDAAEAAVHAAAEALYRTAVSPRRRASAIVDNSDPEHPRRQFADSC